ncbi:hypothetical protein [Deinococcus arenicola]|uniref:Minor tail protein n=1 Tax=Deinococcus arenicola TaxID=2994950 RepID=A0ABU4DUD7_9DEIO|nr:hypothetical protein [Deinococcus sp. ZS9-10]MDV6376032.1 hypothetical protein [Deinococcus sp. ZS9-10]
MWRFRFGDPATSAPVSTILASAAQVTEAGLTVDLDEWGGNKKASWAGLTGPVQDNSRVWIDVQDAAAPGGYRAVFSGVMVRRPSLALGEREALGDKYYRLKWIPVERHDSWPTGAEKGTAAQPGYTGNIGSKDLGRSLRVLGEEAKLSLPHLTVNTTGIPATIGVQLRREYRGESMADALNGLLTGKPGWGWTTLPDDRLYVGPPPSRVAVLNAALVGVRVEFRDVSTEGLLNAVRWVYLLPDRSLVSYESRDASVATLGRYSISRYVDQRSAGAVVENVPATYYQRQSGGEDVVTTEDENDSGFLRGVGNPRTSVGLVLGLRAVLSAPADWVDVEFMVFPGAETTLTEQDASTSFGEVYTSTSAGGDRFTLSRHSILLDTGDQISLTHSDVSMSGNTSVYELNPRRLNRTVLDHAAGELYRLPPVHVATASEFGLQAPAGQVTVKRRGQPDVTEKCVGTRYLIARPLRTEYLIGDTDEPLDARVLSVLVDRKDDVAVDRAVNAGVTG